MMTSEVVACLPIGPQDGPDEAQDAQDEAQDGQDDAPEAQDGVGGS